MRSVPATVVFTRGEANRLGWTDSSLRRAVRSGRLVRLRRGHFALAPEITPELAALAAAAAVPNSLVSHRSALLLHGLPIVGPRPPVPELTVPPLGRVAVLGAHMHRATTPPEHITSISQHAVTTVGRTLIDVARHRPAACAVAAIDAALHRELATVHELREIVEFCSNWPGIRRATRALALADGRAESLLESVSRLVLRWLKLPIPDLQPRIHDEFDTFVGRLDFYWDEYGVFGEADGRSKYSSRGVLLTEKGRQEELEDTGLVGVRWGWDDITREPRYTQYRIERAFERGTRRDRSGFTRLWSVRRTPAARWTVNPADGPHAGR